MGSQEPNRALAEAIATAGISRKGLARRVRDLAHARGIANSADHITVKRWLDGTQPRTETAQLVASALSEKLGRPITVTALGFTAAPPPEPLPLRGDVSYPDTAAEATHALSAVAAADVDDRTTTPWDEAASAKVIAGYLFGQEPTVASSTASTKPHDATAIRVTTARLMDLDFQVGGGGTRQLLLFYLRNDVLPSFANVPAGPARTELFAATAELAQMLGWSAYDAGRHGAAQRYFVAALRLAREAGDDLLGARLLGNLSHQANYLGRFNDAVQLAKAAQHAAQRSRSATTVAMLHAMEARALASLGDHQGCGAALNSAERAFERSNPDRDPAWIGYFNQAELAGEAAHCFRDLGRPIETRTFTALAIDPKEAPPRTRALINMVTAAGALQAGDLDEALGAARDAMQLATSLRSARYERYVSDFVTAVRERHPNEPRLIELLENARSLNPADSAS